MPLPTPHVPSPADQTVEMACIPILALGLRRALARQHGWNESLLGHATQVVVASEDLTRISPDALQPGAPEPPT